MADSSNSDDWLPPGWRMELRVRKFGRKDKVSSGAISSLSRKRQAVFKGKKFVILLLILHYYAPSGQKFFSKLKVLCHLKNNSPTGTHHLQVGKDARVDHWHHSSFPSKENKEVIVDQCAVDTHNNGESCSPTSMEKGKPSPDISTYFSCNSMDSSLSALGEENQVIEQIVKTHCGDTPSISCLLPKDEKTNTDGTVLEITGGRAAKKLQSEKKGIFHPSAENRCAKNLEEDPAFKKALTVGLDLPSMDASIQATQSSSPIRRQKKNGRHQSHAKTKVVVQKCVAEGLPEGWTKEIKVKKKNGNIRKDPYYKDPASGFVFRSMKDVLRYLKTGDIGRLAFKPKDKSSGDIELEDEETISPLTKKQKLAETCSSHRNEVLDDLPEKVLPPSHAGHFEGLRIPACARDKSEDNSPKLSKAVQQEQSEGKNNCKTTAEAQVISEELLQKKGIRGENKECGGSPQEITESEPIPEEGKNKEREPCSQKIYQIIDYPEESKQISPCVEESKGTTSSSHVQEKVIRKPRRMKEINLPRRTSSRLAGVAVDPTVEIPSRASRGTAKHIGREGSSQVKPEIQSTLVLEGGSDSNCSTTRGKDTTDGNSTIIGVATHTDSGNSKNMFPEKRALPFELPLPDILLDPCIEFAIKTLTGIDFNILEDAFQPSNGMNPEIADRSGAKNQEQGVDVCMASATPSLPEEHCPAMQEAAGEMPSSSLRDSWMDPCIDFAIKTLTGAIPVDYDLNVQEIIHPGKQ